MKTSKFQLLGFPEIDEELDSSSSNLITNKAVAIAMENLDRMKIDGAFTENGYLYLTSNGETVAGPLGPFSGTGGGGGGTGNEAILTLSNTSGWLSKKISHGAKCPISFVWSSLENGIPTGNGVLKIIVNGTTKSTADIKQGDITIDPSEYLTAGSNAVKINVSDVYGNSRTINYSVEAISISVSSPFDASVPYTGDISYPYTPVGSVEKTMHFILDGEEIGTEVVTTSGRQRTFTIPAQSHKVHTFEVYFESDIEGETVPSNRLYYELICLEESNQTPIIASGYTDTEAEQYATISIPYIVYNPASLTSNVTLEENGKVISRLTVDRTQQTWSYCPMDEGETVLAIRCGDTVKVFSLNVSESSVKIEAETESLGLYLSSYGRSNNEENPSQWKYGNIEAKFSGFNHVSDGWQLDNDGVTVLRIAGDARLEIPYKIFANDFRTTGKTIEIEMATRDVLNYDSIMLSCMSGGRGIDITTQMATFASEQSAISTKYKEEEHIRISFVVEKRSGNKMLLCYINGILSRCCLYSDDDDFSQVLPVNITIGSNDCTTDIYCIRVYDNDLTRYQMLDNWIADTQDALLRRERFERNNIYDTYGNITIETLKKDTPYLVLTCPVLPKFKGDKKTCSGYYVDPVHPERNFSFYDAEIDVQGTSSQYYWVKNYKIKFKGGFILTDGKTVDVYQLNEDSVPTNTYTMKADVASIEGFINVVLAQLYNELCPVKTPPQEVDPRVRQTIDGHPIVIFWDSGDGPKFHAKYNFNHDKGTAEVFGFSDGDESWEILQNGTDRVGFRSADFSGTDWQNDFEARYPDGNTNTTKLAEFAAWVASTDTEQATGESLEEAVTYNEVEYTSDTAEYRLAKFVAELPDHASVDALVFYYVFTLIFLCIDQREKNGFPTWFRALGVMLFLFYDADSSMGTDNKGNLTFDYFLEDIDYTDAGDPVYNGQNSVLWVNIRKGFYDKITKEYQRLRTTIRTDGTGNPLLSYDVVMDKIKAHKSVWCEAIYNEDAYKKCIEPYVLNGDAFYLPMLFGDKESYLMWWLYNRFRYMDSMFVTGSSMSTRITIRAHAKGNIKLISYVNMYGHVYYNSEMVEHRMFRGQEYEYVWSATGAEDAVIGINDADMLTSIGDLSPLMVETIDISPATHLTELKCGDASEDYVNNSMTTLTLGNNVLLRLIDSRNCVTLAGAIDASGCTGLEEAYFDGTAITGLKLPNGGNLKILHLPETITNLTLRNQTALTEFVLPSFANISTLRLENVSEVVDVREILNGIPASSRVRIIGFDWTFESAGEITALYNFLDTMRGLDENGNNVDNAQMMGVIRVDKITSGILVKFAKKYPDIEFVYRELILNTILGSSELGSTIL